MSYKLYQGLKKTYRHFFLNIGSKGFSHNSGLFIASKYPVSDPQFVPYRFKGRQKAINKGYFAFDLMSEDHRIARVVTTHLQPGDSNKDKTIRHHELQMVSVALKNGEIVSDLRILCGDLNIDRGSDEAGLGLIRDSYLDPWIQEDGSFEETNFEGNRGESIDYCLIDISAREIETLTTDKVIAYEESRSDSDLSDHHGVIVQIKNRRDWPK
jgi:hypothetical protein